MINSPLARKVTGGRQGIAENVPNVAWSNRRCPSSVVNVARKLSFFFLLEVFCWATCWPNLVIINFKNIAISSKKSQVKKAGSSWNEELNVYFHYLHPKELLGTGNQMRNTLCHWRLWTRSRQQRRPWKYGCPLFRVAFWFVCLQIPQQSQYKVEFPQHMSTVIFVIRRSSPKINLRVLKETHDQDNSVI